MDKATSRISVAPQKRQVPGLQHLSSTTSRLWSRLPARCPERGSKAMPAAARLLRASRVMAVEVGTVALTQSRALCTTGATVKLHREEMQETRHLHCIHTKGI